MNRSTVWIITAIAVHITSLCFTNLSQARAENAAWRDQLKPFLDAHCIDCHEGAEAEGQLDFSMLGNDLNDAELMRRWVLVHDRISFGEMPPADESQPAKAEIVDTLSTLATALTTVDRVRDDVVLRRLNRNEYENTVRDLFDIDVRVKEILPEDTSTSGFDNVGEGLAVSAEAMQAYLVAADQVLDAVFGPSKKPKYIQHETNLLEQTEYDGKPRMERHIGKMFRRTDKGLVIFQSDYCPTHLVNFGRLNASPGTYRGTIQVRAIQSEDPVTLRVYAGDTNVGRREKHLVGYFDIPPDKWTTIEFTDQLVESGGTFHPKCYGTRDTRKDANTYPEPGIEIGDITIEGPLEAWPPPSRAALLGDVDPQHGSLDDIKTILHRLLPRAFRRTTNSEEVTRYANLASVVLSDGRSFESALRLCLKAVLCSPEFLFLDEPGRETISQFALASRLSYFLWSSMPDRELLTLASRGKLDNPNALRAQVERMLGDPKAQAFTINFTGQWLDLREIDFTSPDMSLYPEFDELLKISMVTETHRFFEEVLGQDLSLMTFIDSDFTFVNERLAKHYGIDGVRGQEFRRITLPNDSVRGGLMTQASVLKVTANGTNTSPVLRGVWIMEKILGQETPPPPSDVPSVEPDTRGATTIRQQLAKHRNVQSCAVCHMRIDPPGFALENFNPIGGWQDRYRTMGEGERPDFQQSPITYRWIRYRIGLPVDASGQTPDGEPFHDVRDFKRLILEDPRAIAIGITEKLITYSTGRRLGFSDRLAVANIVSKVNRQNGGLRSSIHEIVQSELFRRP